MKNRCHISHLISNEFKQPVTLRPSPQTIRKSTTFWWFQEVQKSNNPLKHTQHHHQNLTTIIYIQKMIKFAHLQVLQLQVLGSHCLIWLLSSSWEFRFLYLFGILFHNRLPLKHSVCVPYRQVLVSDSFNKQSSQRLHLIIFKSKKFQISGGLI